MNTSNGKTCFFKLLSQSRQNQQFITQNDRISIKPLLFISGRNTKTKNAKIKMLKLQPLSPF